MLVIAVANTKGGCGKTTLATHLAADFARRGFATGLADLDRQKSALSWLARRPAHVPAIQGINLAKDEPIPRSLDRLVVDAAAAMGKGVVKDIVQQAEMVLVPVLPGAFDEDGTRRFMDHLTELKPVRKHKRSVAFVANRVRLNTRALARLDAFLDPFDFPVVARLREAQVYTTVAADGLSLFDLTGRQGAGHRPDWAPLFDHIERACRT